MRDASRFTLEDTSEELKQIVAKATENARAKNARLRLLRERNQIYLASRRDELDEDREDDVDQEFTREL